MDSNIPTSQITWKNTLSFGKGPWIVSGLILMAFETVLIRGHQGQNDGFWRVFFEWCMISVIFSVASLLFGWLAYLLGFGFLESLKRDIVLPPAPLEADKRESGINSQPGIMIVLEE